MMKSSREIGLRGRDPATEKTRAEQAFRKVGKVGVKSGRAFLQRSVSYVVRRTLHPCVHTRSEGVQSESAVPNPGNPAPTHRAQTAYPSTGSDVTHAPTNSEEHPVASACDL